jgi:hypothetical protein
MRGEIAGDAVKVSNLKSIKDGILQFYRHIPLAVHVVQVCVARHWTGTASDCIIDINAYDIKINEIDH